MPPPKWQSLYKTTCNDVRGATTLHLQQFIYGHSSQLWQFLVGESELIQKGAKFGNWLRSIESFAVPNQLANSLFGSRSGNVVKMATPKL
jgi:hypothetical protein